ncbi:MAG: hypothetical protein ACI9EF_000609 [Pseudohongiellaceae bacterium]|jgi:hypothetical protein
MINHLKKHTLIWLIPAILVPLIIGVIAYLAQMEVATPDSPFIYDI